MKTPSFLPAPSASWTRLAPRGEGRMGGRVADGKKGGAIGEESRTKGEADEEGGMEQRKRKAGGRGNERWKGSRWRVTFLVYHCHKVPRDVYATRTAPLYHCCNVANLHPSVFTVFQLSNTTSHPLYFIPHTLRFIIYRLHSTLRSTYLIPHIAQSTPRNSHFTRRALIFQCDKDSRKMTSPSLSACSAEFENERILWFFLVPLNKHHAYTQDSTVANR